MTNKKTGKKINGGARPGAGRKPDWLKEKCKELIDKHKLLEYVARVAAGEETEQRVIVVREGNSAHTEVEEVRCSTHDRLHAFDLLMERGFGKAVQEMIHSAGSGSQFILVCPESKG